MLKSVDFLSARLPVLRPPLHEQKEDVGACAHVRFLRQLQDLHRPEARRQVPDPEAQEDGHCSVPVMPRLQVQAQPSASHALEAWHPELEELRASGTGLSRKFYINMLLVPILLS